MRSQRNGPPSRTHRPATHFLHLRHSENQPIFKDEAPHVRPRIALRLKFTPKTSGEIHG
jgi:hypothetical protein